MHNNETTLKHNLLVLISVEITSSSHRSSTCLSSQSRGYNAKNQAYNDPKKAPGIAKLLNLTKPI